MAERALLAWSGGKDSSLTLETLRRQGVEVAGLLTTVTEKYDRVSIHGVRRALLRRQAESSGLPLREVPLPTPCTDEEYGRRMGEALRSIREEDPRLTAVAFGDLFLENIKKYREERLAPAGLKALFPLWGEPTPRLARSFLKQGFRAAVTCVDTTLLPASFAGRFYDAAFLEDLPVSVDPCGERGEFHTFVFDGPVFSFPLRLQRGETVLRDNRFLYADWLEVADDEQSDGIKSGQRKGLFGRWQKPSSLTKV